MTVAKPVGLWGAYAMGLAFAFGWTPCIGPILAAILAVAASEATVAKGAGLLAVYSLGPRHSVRAAAFAAEPFAAFLSRFRAHAEGRDGDGRAAGADRDHVSDRHITTSFWLLETFPALGRSELSGCRPVGDRPAGGFPGARELQHAEVVEAVADDLQADRQAGSCSRS